MTAKKFHVGKNGASECHATKRACRYGDDQHHETMEKAQQAFQMKTGLKTIATMTRKKTTLTPKESLASFYSDFKEPAMDANGRKVYRVLTDEECEAILDETDEELHGDTWRSLLEYRRYSGDMSPRETVREAEEEFDGNVWLKVPSYSEVAVPSDVVRYFHKLPKRPLSATDESYVAIMERKINSYRLQRRNTDYKDYELANRRVKSMYENIKCWNKRAKILEIIDEMDIPRDFDDEGVKVIEFPYEQVRDKYSIKSTPDGFEKIVHRRHQTMSHHRGFMFSWTPQVEYIFDTEEEAVASIARSAFKL